MVIYGAFYFFSYYHLEGTTEEHINRFLSRIIDENLSALVDSSCIEILDDNRTIQSLVLGRIASFYYLQHTTVKLFKEQVKPDASIDDLLKVLTVSRFLYYHLKKFFF